MIDVKDDPILSFQIKGKEIYLVFKNRIKEYSLITGNQIAEKEFPTNLYGGLISFAGIRVYITADNGDLINLHQTDSTKIFVCTDQGKVLLIDNQLEVAKTIEPKDLSVYYLQTKDLNFVEKDNKTLIINNEGKRIAEVQATSHAFLVDNVLYDSKDKRFIAIDLNKIINHKEIIRDLQNPINPR